METYIYIAFAALVLALVLIAIVFQRSSPLDKDGRTFVTAFDTTLNANVTALPSDYHGVGSITLTKSQANREIFIDGSLITSVAAHDFCNVVIPLASTMNAGDSYSISIDDQGRSQGFYITENIDNSATSGTFNSHFYYNTSTYGNTKLIVTETAGVRKWKAYGCADDSN